MKKMKKKKKVQPHRNPWAGAPIIGRKCCSRTYMYSLTHTASFLLFSFFLSFPLFFALPFSMLTWDYRDGYPFVSFFSLSLLVKPCDRLTTSNRDFWSPRSDVPKNSRCQHTWPPNTPLSSLSRCERISWKVLFSPFLFRSPYSHRNLLIFTKNCRHQEESWNSIPPIPIQQEILSSFLEQQTNHGNGIYSSFETYQRITLFFSIYLSIYLLSVYPFFLR